MLDPASPMPLYHQLADDIAARIRGGEFTPGNRIPSEHELAARFAVGRPTVRQATEVLVRKRVLTRRRGAGTFVNERLPEVDLFSLGGTLASFTRSGLELKMRWLQRPAKRIVPADPDNPLAGAAAYTMTRLSSLARRPVLLERLFFDPDRFKGMTRPAPGSATSLSAHIRDRFNVIPTGGRQTFTVQTPAPEVAGALNLAPDDKILLVRRVLDFPSAASTMFAELHCHTGELVFAQELGAIPYA
jgi:GntR family transcriptional regulator